MKKILHFLKKKVVYIPLGIIVLIIGGFMLYGATHKPVYETAIAAKREFSEEVSATGKVVAANDVALGFETGGKVARIGTSVGSEVKKGTVLASVGGGQLYASLLAEHARLESAKIDLAEVLRGTRTTELENIQNNFDQSESDLKNEVRDSFATTDDVLRSKIDIMFTNPTGSYPQVVGFDNSTKESQLEQKRVEIGKTLTTWRKSLAQLETSEYQDSYRVEAEKNLRFMREFLDDFAIASSYFAREEGITDEEAATYAAAISSGRAAINTQINTLGASYQAYLTARGKLDLSTEGATSEEIQRAEIAVKSAQANVLRASSALAETTITAPFDGVVTKIDLRVGELVSPSTPVVSMISNANFEIESYIPEADISKVEVGYVGTTTLDAYGDSVMFAVVVTAIDLSETEVDGVSTYKTTLQFTTSDDRIRSGMTANIDLVSETRQGVLSIPQTALINKEGKRSVLVSKEDGSTESRSIKTGLIDNEGNIEILDGLNEGEVVVTNPPKK